MTGPSDPLAPAPPAKASKRRGGGPLAKENRRLVAGLILGGLAAAFALLNLDEVHVNWILGSGRTPLIVVIAASFALGAAAGSIVGAARRRRGGKGSP